VCVKGGGKLLCGICTIAINFSVRRSSDFCDKNFLGFWTMMI
jgi:hypothetical protein